MGATRLGLLREERIPAGVVDMPTKLYFHGKYKVEENMPYLDALPSYISQACL